MFDKWFALDEKPYSDEDAAWDAFVASHPHGSLLQTTNWARLKNRFGWSSQRVWLKQDGRFVAGAQILFRSAVLGMFKIGYIPHGPLVDWKNEEQIEVLFSQIDQSVYQHGAGILKMEPLLWQKDTSESDWDVICEKHHCLITIDTIQPPNTIMVDLQPSEDEILAAMKQKTRYNIRLSARKDVTVREGSADDVPIFNQLMQVTGQRDNFGTHAPEYYRDAFQLFAPNEAVLLIAEYEARPLAAAFITAFGKTGSYLYGASGNEERNRMPAYAIQWAAMRWAKEKGCTQYDLWGIPDAPEDQLETEFTGRTDGLWPVYRAKRGYGGQIQRTVGAADRVYNQRLYRLYYWWRNR
ncbi:MAG: peptidoglycan bridge formation glycyltransferase FemA/FemB family protein [Chloroflexi bacterium]|jgi:lipid II:glycine glycyltransferase (peptidoglycan interpeptide bridge formation enzyme)|nr:peptidoglycan bridge formation glycyltransferase FemA/FemB family protein [Chloroflexota bacterium]